MTKVLNPQDVVAREQEGSFAKKFYTAAWRWHFYAGVYVVPFLLMLALTGLVMLYQPQIEAVQYGDRLFVTVEGETVRYSEQLAAVQAAYPEGSISRFRPNTSPTQSSEVSVSTADGRDLTVYVNPYTAEILGEVDNNQRWATIATNIHGTLLIGDTGDRLIEIAAGFAVVLLITGLYLWWPRENGVYRAFVPSLKGGKRVVWRNLHSTIGAYVGLALLFYLISGLSWTGVWGDRYVQAWNTFPAQMWNDVPLSHANHEDLNHTGEKIVPWNLENTPLPASGSLAGQTGIPADVGINLDTITQYVRENGLDYGFWVAFPEGEEGVWTVSASSMSRDTADPREDITIHIDQYTGNVLATVGWDDYSLGAKAMAAGIPLHQGTMGWGSVLLGTVATLSIAFLSISGVAMWWLRRPQGAWRLAAPPLPANMPLWKGAVVVMLLVSFAFPLVGITLLTVLALDLLLIQRLPFLQRALN